MVSRANWMGRERMMKRMDRNMKPKSPEGDPAMRKRVSRGGISGPKVAPPGPAGDAVANRRGVTVSDARSPVLQDPRERVFTPPGVSVSPMADLMQDEPNMGGTRSQNPVSEPSLNVSRRSRSGRMIR